MASQHAAALGAGAACVGAALAAKVAVLGLVQILSVALEEDQTEAEWATDRLNRLRLRSRQLRQQRRRNRRQAYAPPLPYIRFQWTLAMMSEEWIKKRMIFTTAELDRILPLLHLQDVQWSYGYRPSPQKALCIFLARLSWPLRLHDMVDWFGCSRSQLSTIFNDVAIFLFQRFRNKLFFDRRRLTQRRMEWFSRAIERQGGGDRVWGWIDGTINRICRPTDDQREYYSGYKKAHGYKYQAVMTPDGIMSSLAGPTVASHGDWYVFVESGFEAEIVAIWRDEQVDRDRRLFVYGDPAYCGSRVVMGAYKKPPGAQLTPEQALFNREMSACRISVEHGFAHVQNRWMRNAFQHVCRIGSSPLAAYYTSAVLLANIYTCLRGNQISKKFGLRPPTLEEYMADR
jgi:AraC-like DNA-binding protein